MNMLPGISWAVLVQIANLAGMWKSYDLLWKRLKIESIGELRLFAIFQQILHVVRFVHDSKYRSF
jgi:hypothetical protein